MKMVGGKKMDKILKFLVFFISFFMIFPILVKGDECYLLICRGGGNAKIEYVRVGGGIYNLKIIAKGSLTKANGLHPLQPGYCAWLDRGFRQDEMGMDGSIELIKFNEGSPWALQISSNGYLLYFSGSRRHENFLNTLFNSDTFRVCVKRINENIYEIK